MPISYFVELILFYIETRILIQFFKSRQFDLQYSLIKKFTKSDVVKLALLILVQPIS